jgi:glycine/D-amino acid oxidase-like deaminating enzyme
MISDAPPDATKFHDICLIGAGPVGISLALELAALGRDVLLLESGGERRSGETQTLSTARIADPLRHDDMEIAVSRQFGGTSELWGGRCVPYDPVDFSPRPVLSEALWPINERALKPYYDQACRYAGCGDAVFEDPAASDPEAPFSYSTLERWSNRPRFRKAYRERLAASRTIDVRLHSTATGFALGEEGMLETIEVADRTGHRVNVRARHFVVCAGGVETARLLLTLQRQRPAILGGLNGPLGRFYMGHLIGEIADVQLSSAARDRALDF